MSDSVKLNTARGAVGSTVPLPATGKCGNMPVAPDPGPWSIVEYGDDETPALVIHRDSQMRICFMATPGSHGDPAIIEANARLIAAAPDLLAALKRLSGGMNADFDSNPHVTHEEVQMARAAIAKAEGKNA